MEATGKPKSKLSERRLFQRLLSWLFAVFAVAAAPLATGGLFDIDETDGPRTSRELRFSEPPLRYLTLADMPVLSESAETERLRKKDLKGDCDDGASAIFAPPPIVGDVPVVLSFAAADQVRQNPTAGFSSRAPPALG